MLVSMFQEKFDRFLEEQKGKASPRRLEMLNGDLTGTVKLFQSTLFPVFRTFDGFELEYEMIGINGVRIYLNTVFLPLYLGFECEGFVVHADTITRERHSFERGRIRTMQLKGCQYVPFTYDELDKRSQHCQSYVHELLGMYGWGTNGAGAPRAGGIELNLYEREVVRHAAWLNRPIRIKDACECLDKKKLFGRRVIESLASKGLVHPARQSVERVHEYILDPSALLYIR